METAFGIMSLIVIGICILGGLFCLIMAILSTLGLDDDIVKIFKKKLKEKVKETKNER